MFLQLWALVSFVPLIFFCLEFFSHVSLHQWLKDCLCWLFDNRPSYLNRFWAEQKWCLCVTVRVCLVTVCWVLLCLSGLPPGQYQSLVLIPLNLLLQLCCLMTTHTWPANTSDLQSYMCLFCRAASWQSCWLIAHSCGLFNELLLLLSGDFMFFIF